MTLQTTNSFQSLQDAVSAVCGDDVKILRQSPVSGGDINLAYQLTLSDGRKLFLKENAADKLDFFVTETEGLAAIRGTNAITVPEIYGYGTDKDHSFLLMEFMEPGSRQKDFFEDFGRRLAVMHRADCREYTGEGSFGFNSDNYIGAGHQENTPEKSWIAFFRDHRLLPQIRRAKPNFDEEALKVFDRLLDRLDQYLTEPEKPALLHGDLWSGNYVVGKDGLAALIDPAVYVGHPEADIAMTELFGGFPRAFYDGYYEVMGRTPGYEERRDLYNLYHLLNHLNLFGSSYYGAVMRIAERYS